MKKATMYFSFSHNQSCFTRWQKEGLMPDLAHPQLQIEIENQKGKEK